MNEDRVWELQRILRLIPAILHNQFDIRLTDVDSMLITARRKNKVSSLDSDEISRLQDLINNKEAVNDADIRSAQYLINNLQMKKGTPQLHEVFEKLSLKSKEALVSGDSSLDEFHQYLHVPRPIEHEFEKVLKEVVPNNEQTLTLIVGNVGDGKSHLLAFEQSKNSVIFSEQNIQIHNDATESNSPKLTAIQTLIEKMDNFDGASGEKQHLVVAINMGILLRFANTVREKGQYTELLSFLDDSGILEDSNATSKIGDRFQLITFRDSPIFSFNGTGVQSDFIERLLSKITDASVKNPFYRAYEHDKGLAATPELSNYELLLNQNVQKSLELLLVKVQIVYGQLLSTRQILNFIHDVIVPPLGTDDYAAELPMLLFNGANRSSVLKFIAKLDPILNQNRAIDKINSCLFNTLNFTAEAERIFDELDLSQDFIKSEQMINRISNLKENKSSSTIWGQNINFVLRLLSLLKPQAEPFVDPIYDKYIAVLEAADNRVVNEQTRDFEKMIRSGLLKWNGFTPKKGYTYTNSVDQNVAIAVKVLINRDAGVKRLGTHLALEASFDGASNYQPLDVDFQIYKLISQVVNGFTLRKIDIQSAVDFDHYVQQLISNSHSDSVLIRVPETNNFIRIYDDGLGYEAESIKGE